MLLPKLSLPEYDFRITEKEGETYIWDDIRKKDIVLTEEEWVRQNFVNLLVHHLKYPRSLIRVESGLTYNRKAKRSDVTVRSRKGSVFLLVECKAPGIRIDHKSLSQISLYNKTLKADYIAITNGLKHFFWHFQGDEYTPLNAAPSYPANH